MEGARELIWLCAPAVIAELKGTLVLEGQLGEEKEVQVAKM